MILMSPRCPDASRHPPLMPWGSVQCPVNDCYLVTQYKVALLMLLKKSLPLLTLSQHVTTSHLPFCVRVCTECRCRLSSKSYLVSFQCSVNLCQNLSMCLVIFSSTQHRWHRLHWMSFWLDINDKFLSVIGKWVCLIVAGGDPDKTL